MSEHAEIFYGRRRGKTLRPNRARLVNEVLPTVAITPERLAAERGNWREVWLEVGFGAGEHLAAQAAANPDVLMIGCEPFMNGVSTLLSHMEEGNLKNIRVLANDARPFLDALPDASLDRVFVLFNDPWPKARHAERRFIGQTNLDRLARVMKQGTELRLASDHPILKRWMLAQARAHAAFRWHLETCSAWKRRPADWPPTRYEKKAIAEGRRPIYVIFKRV